MRLIHGDALTKLQRMDAQSVHCVVTSPPYYGLRDYSVTGQIGLEESPAAYVARLVEVFREVRRVLRDDGTLWLNLGDSYVNHYKIVRRNCLRTHQPTFESTQPERAERRFMHGKRRALGPGQLFGIPWRVAFALQADGWILRQDVIWHKPNQMPESVRSRCTKAHEYVFLLVKKMGYNYDAEAIQERSQRSRAHTVKPHNGSARQAQGMGRKPSGNGVVGSVMRTGRFRNRRSVWAIATQGYKGAHFATFPPKLVEPCILAGCPEGGIVLDPFAGACTVGLVCQEHGRDFIGIDLNRDYLKMGRRRMAEARGKAAVT